MIVIRRSQERGSANFHWLESLHTFSFGHYYDPRYMGFGPLRVINEDRVTPGEGFATHRHQNMEILTYVIDGALEHKDSIGNGSVIKPGDMQRMSAGTGISHSEYNASKSDSVHFLQIWLMPNVADLAPSYEQIHFPITQRQNQLQLVGSPDGHDGSVVIHQDVQLYASALERQKSVSYSFDLSRQGWIQVVKGQIEVNGEILEAGDGAAVLDQASTVAPNRETLMINGVTEQSEFLLFDLPQ